MLKWLRSPPPPPQTESHDVLLEKKLRKLHNTNRLAIHVWEKSPYLEYPPFSGGTLSHMRLNEIDQQLQDGTCPLLSMSLVPCEPMLPYMVKKNRINDGIYLIDLSQNRENPARVVRVSPTDLDTGRETDTKDAKVGRTTAIPELDEYYGKFTNKADLMKAVSGKGARRNCELQLDALGGYFNRIRDKVTFSKRDGLSHHNEMLVAAANDHIAAIAVPFYADKAPPSYAAVQQLCAAVLGKQHLERDINVPVVFYRMKSVGERGPECADGDFDYLAQGHEELHALAYKAIQAIKASKDRQLITPELIGSTKEVFGIDLERPLSEQHEAMELLRREAKGVAADVDLPLAGISSGSTPEHSFRR